MEYNLDINTNKNKKEIAHMKKEDDSNKILHNIDLLSSNPFEIKENVAHDHNINQHDCYHGMDSFDFWII